MAQEYISIPEKIKRCHAMKNALPCMDFDYSIDTFVGFWYAEDRLYVVHDSTTDAYFFEIAKSPAEAVTRVKKRYDWGAEEV